MWVPPSLHLQLQLWGKSGASQVINENVRLGTTDQEGDGAIPAVAMDTHKNYSNFHLLLGTSHTSLSSQICTVGPATGIVYHKLAYTVCSCCHMIMFYKIKMCWVKMAQQLMQSHIHF